MGGITSTQHIEIPLAAQTAFYKGTAPVPLPAQFENSLGVTEITFQSFTPPSQKWDKPPDSRPDSFEENQSSF